MLGGNRQCDGVGTNYCNNNSGAWWWCWNQCDVGGVLVLVPMLVVVVVLAVF